MSTRTTMTDHEVEEMQRLIDEGILLAQHRLCQRAMHDGLTLIVTRNGKLMELKANEI